MNAEPRILRTKAEEELAAGFRAARHRLPGGKAFGHFRDAAFAAFDRSGLPHRRIETWKYTDLRTLMRSSAPPAGAAAPAILDALMASDPLASLDRARIVVVNGAYRPDLSDLAGADGVIVASVADVLASDPERVARAVAGSDDTMLALNTAFLAGGVAVTVAAGAKPARPVEIVHLAAVAAPEAVYARDLIAIGANAEVRFIDTYRGPAGLAYQVNTVTGLDVGSGANVRFARLQAEGDGALHIGSLLAEVGRDAGLDHLVVSAGAALSRWQAFVTVAGPGARAGFSGANMLAGREHGDLLLVLDHAAPHSASREVFKSVVDGEAEGAFQGRIVVKPGAQKTDAKMMTQALLLSDRAEFDQKPELEIFADDVQCGHGATAGRIDENGLFYLLARGIARPEAERLMIEAFLADAIDAFGDEAIGVAMKGVVGRWLEKREGAAT